MIIEYADEFTWCLVTTRSSSPEEFARQTRADLGLPLEFEPQIAFKIREHIYRRIISALNCEFNASDGENLGLSNITSADKGSQANITGSFPNISVISPQVVVETISNVWKKYRPTTVQWTEVLAPALFPSDKSSNSHIWR